MRVFFLSVTLGMGTLMLGYAMSESMDRRGRAPVTTADTSSSSSPPAPLRGIKASPVDLEKWKGFRKGMGFR